MIISTVVVIVHGYGCNALNPYRYPRVRWVPRCRRLAKNVGLSAKRYPGHPLGAESFVYWLLHSYLPIPIALSVVCLSPALYIVPKRCKIDRPMVCIEV